LLSLIGMVDCPSGLAPADVVMYIDQLYHSQPDIKLRVKTDSKVGTQIRARQVAAYRWQSALEHPMTTGPVLFDSGGDDLPMPLRFGMPVGSPPEGPSRFKHWPEAVDDAVRKALLEQQAGANLVQLVVPSSTDLRRRVTIRYCHTPGC
jgi:hypothetical protein